MTTAQAHPSLEFLQLVAHGHRWQLLKELARSDRRVGELTELLNSPQSLVSYHLAELRNGGLVTSRRSSADRRDTYYRADLARCRSLMAAAGTALHPGLVFAAGVHEPVAGPARTTPRVLFLCTGNSARSQMAEALLMLRSGGAIRAFSAGSEPKALHPNAVRVMAARGMDIAGRPPKHLRRFARTRFDRVITLCDKVREVCPDVFAWPTAMHWSMPDPSAEGATDEASFPAFQRCAVELDTRIELLIAELVPVQQTTKGKSHGK